MTQNYSSWVEVSEEAITQNVQAMRSLLTPKTQFMAMVKSNAYGHGLIASAKAARLGDAQWLGVISPDEALALRAANIDLSILVVGVAPVDAITELTQADVAVCLPSLEWWREAEQVLEKTTKPLRVHLKVDTGLHRLGLNIPELAVLLRELQQNSNIIVEGIYSHLAAVEETKEQETREQIEEFSQASNLAKVALPKLSYRHLAASAAIMLWPNAHFDMVRSGIAIYGLWPSEEAKLAFAKPDFLQPALRFLTRIIQIKTAERGGIGYGLTYQVKSPTKIAVLSVGYADGYDRRLSNCGEVLIGGVRCPIVGRIAMNMLMVNIAGVPAARAGDEVVLIGKQGSEEITADELANKIGTINYEIVTRIPETVPRVSK